MKLLLLVIASLLYSLDGKAYDDSTKKDMPFVTTASYCLDCHTREEARSFRNSTAQSCSVFCSTCHNNLGPHHEIDRYVTGDIPQGIILQNEKIACFTCHDLRNSRQDNVSWKAESLYERMFHRKEIYSTYFLVERNNEGQLCKKCH